MNSKILAAALAISLFALIGLAFAVPGWMRGGEDWQNASQNGTRLFPPWKNGNWNGTLANAPPCQNVDWNGTRPEAPRGGPRMENSTERADFAQYMQEFLNVVQNGDYDSAKKLHEQYGFGGPLFDKLDEGTFAKYSQISKLESELRQELGLNNTIGIGAGPDGFRMGHMGGPGRGMRRNAN